MEDGQILELFWERSEDAVRQVKEKYDGVCMALLRNLLRNEQDAQECANDTYLALWNTIPPERPEPLVTYLLKIARNQGLRRVTYYNAQRRDDRQVITLQELESCLASPDVVEEAVESKLLEEEIEAFLRTLPKEDRQIFLRRYWFCDSLEDIAKRFGGTKMSVKSKLFRLRTRLRNHLIKEGFIDA